MSYFINSNLLNNVIDPNSSDTRRAAVRKISEILKNNIAFNKNSKQLGKNARDELSLVNYTLLVKNLIRYFGFHPVEDEVKVLDLILMILKCQHIFQHITSTISVERLKTELHKVSRICIEEESFEKLDALNELLNYYQRMEEEDQVSEQQTENSSKDSDVDILSSLLHSVKLSQQKVKIPSKCEENYSLKSWKVLNESSMEIFNQLHKTLQDHTETDFVDYTLDYLIKSFDDFPVEFYLQEPYIFEDLLNIFPKVSDSLSTKVLGILRHMTNSLKNRVLTLQAILPLNNLDKSMESRKVISVKKFVNSIMEMAVNKLRLMESNIDSKHYLNLEREEAFVELYYLLFNLVEFVHDTQEFCEIYYSELLNNLAKCAQTFRSLYWSSNCIEKRHRIHYVIIMYLMNHFIAICNVDEISRWSENDLWEHECDILLLDIPLKSLFPTIYKLVKKNRMEFIKSDENMQTLFSSRKSWISVVELLKSSEHYRDEDIVMMGLEALETLQLHKSLDMVHLLLAKIPKTGHLFHRMEELKKASEEVFLRLLSHSMHNVKKLTYKQSGEIVARSLTGQFDRMNSETYDPQKSLCSLIGIPLTSEVLVEILCYGLENEDAEIHKNAEMILFSILRGKCIFGQHWSKFLDVIKPVLPLLTSITPNNERLGLFALEVISSDIGFTDEETLQAYQRFLFSKNYRIREIAVQRIQEILKKGNFLTFLVEILSPDVFLLNDPTSLFDAPSQLDRWDRKACEATLSLLKDVNKNDVSLMRTILLQMKGFMGASEACHFVHDQHAWVYIVEGLDYATANLNNPEIIKLYVDILYKICITVTTFRRYLATEYQIQNCVLQAMIYYNDDPVLKKQCSILMFLFLFNDFFVGNDKNLSLPIVMKKLAIPFKFNVHWEKSPFTKVSKLEALFRNIENAEEDEQKREIKEICWRYLKFVFAANWFESLLNLEKFEDFSNESYFQQVEDGEKVLKFNEKLLLNQQDIQSFFDLDRNCIFYEIFKSFDNSVKHEHVLGAVVDLQRSLILPLELEEKSPILLRKIDRFLNYLPKTDEDIKIFQKMTKLLNHFLVLENQEFIMWSIHKLINQDSVFMKILRNFKSESELYTLVTEVVKNTFKSFTRWSPENMKVLMGLENDCKFQLITKMFEILVENSQNKISDKNDLNHIRYTMVALRQIVVTNQINTDDFHIKKTIKDFFKLSRAIKDPGYMGSGILRNLLTIILCLIKIVKYPELSSHNYEFLYSLCENEDYHLRTLAWNIFAEIASKKENIENLIKEFEALVPDGIFSLVFDTILNENESIIVKSGAVEVLGSLILADKSENKEKDDVDSNHIGIDLLNLGKSQNFCKTLLENLLIEQDSITLISLKCYCYIIKKFINWNSFIICDMLSQQTIQTVFSFIPTAKHLDTLSAVKMVSNACDLLTFCWQLEPFRILVQDCIISMEKECLNDLFIVLKMALEDKSQHVLDMRGALNRNVLNVLKITIDSEQGLYLIKSFLENAEHCETLVKVLGIGLRTQNRYNDLLFYLSFVKQMAEYDGNYEDSLCYLLGKNPANEALINEIVNFPIALKPDCKQMNTLPINTILEEKWYLATTQIDIILIEVLDIYDFVDFSRYSFEYKHDVKLLCYLTIKSFAEKTEKLGKIFQGSNIFSLMCKKFNLMFNGLGGIRYLEATRKFGYKKCKQIIQGLCLFLRIFTDWKVSAEEDRMKPFFLNLLKIYDWIDQDSYLLNNFFSFLNNLMSHRYSKSLLMESFEGPGKPIVLCITNKAMQWTTKSPHTKDNIIMLGNAFTVLKNACQFVEVRLTLKNIFKILDELHPQLEKSKKTTWDDVTMHWLNFIDDYSQYPETELQNGQVSVLCRLVKIANPTIRQVALRIIRNFSLKASIGSVLMNSDDFIKTVDLILSKEGEFIEEKYLVTMTILRVSYKCERLKAKVKNSPLRGIFKKQFSRLQCDSAESEKLSNIISILNQILE